MSHAPPGKLLSRGALRVDAARAISKLRDYQLVDPAHWVLEVVRAAVASGAEEISLEGDADDVWLAWRGAPPDDRALSTLFDELVSPIADPKRRHLRLLAIGVNTALRDRPRSLDLIRVSDAGAARVRYGPDIVEDDDPESVARKLRALEPVPCAVPARAPDRGLLVHLRKRRSYEVLRAGLSGIEPPELREARRACDDVRVPMRIGGGVVGRESSTRDIVRIALGDGIDGFLALTTEAGYDAIPARLDAAEHGVIVASTPIGLVTEPRTLVPLRVFVDAPTLPVDASRSSVRLFESPLAEAIARASERLPDLVSVLVGALGTEPAIAWTAEQRTHASAAVLQLLSAIGAPWDRRGPPALRPLADLPLLRDAVGRAKSPRSFRRPKVVLDEGEPAPEDMAPWLEHIPWIPPGDPAVRLLGGARPRGASEEVRLAKKAIRARRAWLEREVRAPTVPAEGGQWISVPIAGGGLRGEVCLLDPATHRPGIELRLSIEGREIERLHVAAPFPARAAIDGPFLPVWDHRSATRNDVFDRAMRALRRRIRRGLCALAGGLSGKPLATPAVIRLDPFGEGEPVIGRVRDTVRRGLGDAVRTLTGSKDTYRAVSSAAAELLRAEVWPTLDGRWLCVETLRQLPHVRMADPAVAAQVSIGDVVIADEHDRTTLKALLETPTVAYTRGVVRSRVEDRAHDLASRLSGETIGGFALALPDLAEGRRGAIGICAGDSSERIHHMGTPVAFRTLAVADDRLLVAIDDDSVVPAAGWRGIAASEPAPPDVGALRSVLIEALARALLGDPVPELVRSPGTTHAIMLRELLARLPSVTLDAALAARMKDAPWFRIAGETGPRSANAIAAMHPSGAIPYLVDRYDPAELGDFRPVSANAMEIRALEALLRRPVEDARGELGERRRLAMRQRAREAFLARPPFPDPETMLEIALYGRVHGPIGLRTEGGAGRIFVTFRGRKLVELGTYTGASLVGALEVDEDLVRDDYEGLTEEGLAVVNDTIRSAPVDLLEEIVSSAPELVLADTLVRDLVLAVVDEAERGSIRGQELLARVRKEPLFEGVPRAPISIVNAIDDRGLRVARWVDEWLEPEESEEEIAPTIVTKEPEALALLARLSPTREARDVTEELRFVQMRRRVARGIASRPALVGIAARYRRSIEELARAHGRVELFDALGPGEIALVDEEGSWLHLFEGETEREVVALGVEPSVRLAVYDRPARRESRRIAASALSAPLAGVPGIYWAVTAKASSEYGGSWSASSLRGEPRVWPRHGDIPAAWAPAAYGANGGLVSLEITFGRTLSEVAALLVLETHRPGAVCRVEIGDAYDEVVWEAPPEEVSKDEAHALLIVLPRARDLARVRLWCDTRVSGHYPEIDAVGALDEAALASSLPRHDVANPAQALAEILVSEVIADGPVPEWLRRRLRPIASRGEALRDLPSFETTARTWVSFADIDAQATRFGAVWWTRDLACTDTPIEEGRFALRLTDDEAEVLGGAIRLVEARERLAAAERARRVRDAPPVPAVRLEPSEQASAIDTATMDVPQGRLIVAPLRPDRAHLRGARTYRARKPLGEAPDPCGWPTLTLADGHALSPSDGWEGPRDDDAWLAMKAAIRATSEELLARRFAPPERNVLAVRRIDALASRRADPGHAIRGVVWLEEEPIGGALEIAFENRNETLDRGLSGRILVHGGSFRAIAAVIDDAHDAMITSLARELPTLPADRRALAIAHLARAAAAGRLPGEVPRAIEVPCFWPAPLSLADLEGLAASGETIHATKPEHAAEADATPPILLHDGTPASRALAIAWSRRVQTFAPIMDPPPRSPAHPLEGLAHALHEILASLDLPDLVPEKLIVDRRESTPSLSVGRIGASTLSFAGESPLLRAAEAARIARTPQASGALIVLAAHAVGALDRALRGVGEADQLEAIARLLDRA